MSKEEPSVSTDYRSLWSTYNRWEQEDAEWYTFQKDQQEITVSSTKADMARRGIQSGSDSWKNTLSTLKSDEDVDAQYEAKQKDLRDSLAYKDLSAHFEQKKLAAESDYQFLYDEYLEYNSPKTDGDMDMDSDKNKKIIRLASAKADASPGVRDAKSRFDEIKSMTMDEYYTGKFGSKEAASVYGEAPPTAEDQAMARVGVYATGRGGKGSGGSGTSFALAAFEDDPWMS